LAAIATAILVLAVFYLGLIPWVEKAFGRETVFEIFFWLPGMIPELAEKGLTPAVWGISYYLFYAALGALLGEFESRNYSLNRLMGEVVALMALLLLVWLAWYARGDFSALVRGLEGYFTQLIHALLQVPQPNEEVQAQFQFLKERAPQIAAYTVRLLPGMLLNLILFVTWLNLVVSRRIFFKDLLFPALGAMRRWRLPFFVVWLVIGAAFLLIADQYLLHVGWLKFSALNAFLLFALIYFFQGLAIMVFYSVRWALSPMIRFLLYAILVLFFQPIGLLLMAFGFFDSWFDFRRLTPKAAS
jgi:hypothetical protein